MYKICHLLLWLLVVSSSLLFGQSKKVRVSSLKLVVNQAGWLQSDPTAQKPPLSHLTNDVQTARQTVFTAHLLADLVDSGKKYEYDVLTEGQKVSLPYPTQFQTQSLWQWRIGLPRFRFAVGS